VFDIAGRRATWPAGYPARLLRNEFLDTWRDREDALEADDDAKARFRDSVDRGDMAAVPIWASQAIDLIDDVVPAGELVELLARSAEDTIERAMQSFGPRDGQTPQQPD
jgi:nitronate monooxygenase